MCCTALLRREVELALPKEMGTLGSYKLMGILPGPLNQ